MAMAVLQSQLLAQFRETSDSCTQKLLVASQDLVDREAELKEREAAVEQREKAVLQKEAALYSKDGKFDGPNSLRSLPSPVRGASAQAHSTVQSAFFPAQSKKPVASPLRSPAQSPTSKQQTPVASEKFLTPEPHFFPKETAGPISSPGEVLPPSPAIKTDSIGSTTSIKAMFEKKVQAVGLTKAQVERSHSIGYGTPIRRTTLSQTPQAFSAPAATPQMQVHLPSTSQIQPGASPWAGAAPVSPRAVAAPVSPAGASAPRHVQLPTGDTQSSPCTAPTGSASTLKAMFEKKAVEAKQPKTPTPVARRQTWTPDMEAAQASATVETSSTRSGQVATIAVARERRPTAPVAVQGGVVPMSLAARLAADGA